MKEEVARVEQFPHHQRVYLTGEEIMRCRDCIGTIDDGISDRCETFIVNGEDLNGFCKWGERK